MMNTHCLNVAILDEDNRMLSQFRVLPSMRGREKIGNVLPDSDGDSRMTATKSYGSVGSLNDVRAGHREYGKSNYSETQNNGQRCS